MQNCQAETRPGATPNLDASGEGQESESAQVACREGIAHSVVGRVWACGRQVDLLAHRPKMDDSMREGGGWVGGLVSTARTAANGRSFGGKRQRVRKG